MGKYYESKVLDVKDGVLVINFKYKAGQEDMDKASTLVLEILKDLDKKLPILTLNKDVELSNLSDEDLEKQGLRRI